MEELDGDEVRVSSRGRFAERDIVQVRHFKCIKHLPSVKIGLFFIICLFTQTLDPNKSQGFRRASGTVDKFTLRAFILAFQAGGIEIIAALTTHRRLARVLSKNMM